MTSDLAKLMEYIDSLQSEAVPEPVVETEETKVHPLLQAMRELKEEGIVESVDPYTIFNQVKEIHREFRDIEEGDLPDRIYWFDEYKKTDLPLSQIDLDEFVVDEDLIEDYIEYIKDSPNTMPPIVYDPIAKSVIDGMHRANAYARLGYKTIPAYVGLTKSSSYGEREEVDEAAEEPIEEASPDTLEGSFTPDLVESKTWLAEKLAKGLKGKNAGTIYVLGSWYGNMGIFLQQAGVKFDKLVLVEPDEEALLRSKDLLQQLNDDGKLVLIHQNAEDVVYEKPGVVINTSCNETGPVFLTKLPDNMLCLLQARNNNEDTLFPTEAMEDFVDYFPLEKVYYIGEKHLEDPEINYVRFMKIGRTGKQINETVSTGQGGGSAGNNGAQMVGGPTTYEEEYGMFKSKGPRRIMSMTETLDSSYPYEFKNNAYYFVTDAGNDYKVLFNGTDKVEVAFVTRDKSGQIKDTITGTGDSRKVFGTVINIVKDYVSKNQPNILLFAADSNEPSRVKLYSVLAGQASKELPGYNLAKTLKNKMFTTFYLTKDNVNVPKMDTAKNTLHKTLDKVFEDSITLNKLYGDNKPDRDETIWDYGTMIWDDEFPIKTINPNKLNLYLQSQYRIEHYEELFDMMDEEQQEIVEKYVNDPNLSNSIIVLDDGYIVDGNHRALAAVIANKPIKYIDIGEEDEPS